MSDEELSAEELRIKREKEAREGNQKFNNDRLERLNTIANQSDEYKVKDGLEDVPDEAWVEGPQGKVPAEDVEPAQERVIADAEKADREADEAREAGASDVKEVNGVTYYQLIVNGKEQWKTLAELRETSSKVTAADEYLHNAKESAKKALELTPSIKDESDKAEQDRLSGILSRFQMGEAEAANELALLIAKPSRVTPDVLQVVDERVSSQLRFRREADWFGEEYKAELADPVLKARILKRDKEMETLYPDMDYRQRLKEVGDEARAFRLSKGTKTPEPANTKELRKAQVRALPTASQRLSTETEEDDEESYETAISNMAKARGQARATLHKR